MRLLSGGAKALALLGVAVLFQGCVSSQEYTRLKDKHEQQAQVIAQYQQENRRLAAENVQLKSSLDAQAKLLGLTEEQLRLVSTRASELESEKAKLRDQLARGLGPIMPEGAILVDRPEGVAVQVAASLLFDSGKIDIKPTGQKTLTEIAAVLKDRDEILRIDGHTDTDPIRVSPWEDNWHLSTMRALRVRKFLEAQGISPDRTFVAGFGEKRPIAENSTEAGKSKNRRVEILLMPRSMFVIPGEMAPVSRSERESVEPATGS